MSSLAHDPARFVAALLGTDTPPALRDAAESGRFEIYRNNVVTGLVRALASRFPATERLVGGAFFAALAQAFVRRHPPRSPLIMTYGDALPDFLRGYGPARDLPYLPDVARLELARGRAYHAADASPAPPEAVAAAAAGADRARLTLHPSVQRLAAPWAFVTIWQANQPGTAAPGKIEAARAEAALVLRDRQDAVQVETLAPGDNAFLARLMAGHSLLAAAEAATAAEPRHDAGPFLMRLISHGAITQITFGETP